MRTRPLRTRTTNPIDRWVSPVALALAAAAVACPADRLLGARHQEQDQVALPRLTLALSRTTEPLRRSSKALGMETISLVRKEDMGATDTITEAHPSTTSSLEVAPKDKADTVVLARLMTTIGPVCSTTTSPRLVGRHQVATVEALVVMEAVHSPDLVAMVARSPTMEGTEATVKTVS
jgi:hypothetical protein